MSDPEKPVVINNPRNSPVVDDPRSNSRFHETKTSHHEDSGSLENYQTDNAAQTKNSRISYMNPDHGYKEVFRREALLARRPHDWDAIDELNEEDKARIQYEHEHKWSHQFMSYYMAIICAIGAATQGWDQTGSSGANFSFPKEFGIVVDFGQVNGARDEWIVGSVNSALYISAAVLSVWRVDANVLVVSDPLNNLLGRGEIFVPQASSLDSAPLSWSKTPARTPGSVGGSHRSTDRNVLHRLVRTTTTPSLVVPQHLIFVAPRWMYVLGKE